MIAQMPASFIGILIIVVMIGLVLIDKCGEGDNNTMIFSFK